MNWDRWRHLWDDHYPPGNLDMPPGCMDSRHVEMIHAVLISEQPSSIVEIGCFNGFSTAAIVEAWEKADFLRYVDLVDTEMRHTVYNMATQIKRPPNCRVRVCCMGSEVYTGMPQMWVIDGDHGKGAINDYENATQGGARIVVVHDTNPVVADHKKSFGSVEIAKRLMTDASFAFVDDTKRENEWTHRGLVIGFFYEPKPETFRLLESLR